MESMLEQRKNEKRGATKGAAALSKWRAPDLLYVNERDPNFTYRWIKVSDRTPIYGGIDPRGWEIVRRKQVNGNAELTGTLSQFSQQTLDSTFRIGDLILARMPKEKAQERKDAYLERNRLQVEAIKDPKRFVSRQHREGMQGSVEVYKGE